MSGMNNHVFTNETNAKKLYQVFNRVYQEGKLFKGFDWEIIRKDGTVRMVEASVALIKDAEGRRTGFRGIVRDVTEEKRMETQLQRAEKMETVGTLAGGVAHDLNNILSGLVSYPELLLLQLPENSALRKPIATIQQSGQKAVAVVQDLLTLARRAVVVREPLNLNEVILQYLASPEYEKVIEFHPGIEMVTRLESGLLNMMGSITHLSKTVMNLVSNAAEAMPRGGRIVLSTRNQYIDSPVSGYDDIKEGDYVTFMVSDSGTGISPEDIGKIFEPFYTKKRMGRSGTGLGMSVVWGTVKDHQGYIDVRSEEGNGTTFTLFFPATRQALLENLPKTAIVEYTGKGESILVIDDVEQQREMAVEMLRQLRYSVDSVPSGEEALEYLQKQTVDLILLDMIMDHWNGWSGHISENPGNSSGTKSGHSKRVFGDVSHQGSPASRGWSLHQEAVSVGKAWNGYQRGIEKKLKPSISAVIKSEAKCLCCTSAVSLMNASPLPFFRLNFGS